jgi:hypothetical protein
MKSEFRLARHARPCAGYPRFRSSKEDVDGRDIGKRERRRSSNGYAGHDESVSFLAAIRRMPRLIPAANLRAFPCEMTESLFIDDEGCAIGGAGGWIKACQIGPVLLSCRSSS